MTKQSEHKIEADPEPPNFAKLTKLAAEIQTQGYDESTAAHYAVLIGKKQIIDPSDGTVTVVEGDKVLAKLKLRFFSGESGKRTS